MHPPHNPLTVAANQYDLAIRAYVEPVAVGDLLTDRPRFLRPGRWVKIPLEATYQTKSDGLPATLEGRDRPGALRYVRKARPRARAGSPSGANGGRQPAVRRAGGGERQRADARRSPLGTDPDCACPIRGGQAVLPDSDRSDRSDRRQAGLPDLQRSRCGTTPARCPASNRPAASIQLKPATDANAVVRPNSGKNPKKSKGQPKSFL